MNRLFTLFALLAMSVLSSFSAEDVMRRSVTLPGKGNICVEDLQHVDLNMDISHLSLAELRVLRNAFAARQGYAFMSKDLRSLFSTTTWYDSLFYDRWEKIESAAYSDNQETEDAEETENENLDERESYARLAAKYHPLKYTTEEQAFIQRIQEREKELRRQNFQAPAGQRVNMNNLINSWQLEEFPVPLREALGRNGFAIIEGDGIQLFHTYEQNNYTVFPSFVTTDLYLQLFHFYFDCLLRDIEEKRLDSCVTVLCQRMNTDLSQIRKTARKTATREAADWLQAYTAVAITLLSGQTPANVPKAYAQDVQNEVANCECAENDFSAFLGYTQTMFPYSLFRPRGHYTRSEQLQRYFRTMMWLQCVPFCTDTPKHMQRAALLAHIIGSNPQTADLYRQITEPLTFLLGAPDNVGILQVQNEVVRMNMEIEILLASPQSMKQLTARIEQIAEQQTRIRPKYLLTARHKVNLMPQRYMPDAEVLQEMADTDTQPFTMRKTPKALDVMAAMGASAAEQILINELREGEQWPQFTEHLNQMKQRMGNINWHETVATHWLDALKELPTTPDHAPYFMCTPAWEKKSLNTALASYAELKHDAILYAKQPFGAECGGGGPPEPVIKGYVEPSIGFWRKAVALNEAYIHVLRQYELMTEKAESASEIVDGIAKFLLNVSEKELAGIPLYNSENDQIEIIGSIIENVSLTLARSGDEFLMSWDDINGPDRNIACIADVYTANALNIPDEEKCILYEAVGPAYEIYVVVEIEGQLWLTRGAVFSYRELERPVNLPRMTDEEWQQHLQQNPTDGIPSWMKDIIVPLKHKPTPNAEVFYSSGC